MSRIDEGLQRMYIWPEIVLSAEMKATGSMRHNSMCLCRASWAGFICLDDL